MNFDFTNLLTILSSAISALATYFLYRHVFQKSESLYLNSNLGLLFFSAGILQWFLFGVTKNNLVLAITCAVQLPLLFLAIRKFTLTPK